MSTPSTRPRRRVVDALQSEATSGQLTNQRRSVRWWELRLDCGHTVERPVRYSAERSRGWRGGARSGADVLPAVKWARCEQCPPVSRNEGGRA